MFRTRYLSRTTARQMFPGLEHWTDAKFRLAERVWIETGFNEVLIGSLVFFEWCVEND
jgi:hypothetical protein